ncbi:MAG: SoxR reducing system RseC family protein [Bacillota bacterium]
MEERGRVVETLNDLARVEVVRHEACQHCKACDFDRVVVEAANPIGACVGDEVVLELAGARVLGAAFVAYMVPLALMVVGICLGGALARAAGRPGSASLFGAILGLAFLVLSYGGVYLYDKRVNPSRFRAEITRILDPA